MTETHDEIEQSETEQPSILASAKEARGRKHGSRVRRTVAKVALVGTAFLAGSGVSALFHQDDHPKQGIEYSNTPQTQETQAEVSDRFLSFVAHPHEGDSFSVAQETFSLLPGARISDIGGEVSVVSRRIDGIQRPAWMPSTEGGYRDELCYRATEDDQTVCFEVSTNKRFIKAYRLGSDHLLHEVPVDGVTPDQAVEATVSFVEPDGFAKGVIEGPQGLEEDVWIAGRPTE